jgi:hypothetical protein
LDRAEELAAWLDAVSGPEWLWYGKRLSANDTGATGAHQVGFYVPKDVAFAAAPELGQRVPNPSVEPEFRLISHQQEAEPRLIYYNNKLFGGTRDECRLTRFGGQGSPLQQEDSTGAILVVAFKSDGTLKAEAWMCASLEEDEALEAVVGPITPGYSFVRLEDHGQAAIEVRPPDIKTICSPPISGLPAEWQRVFPSGEALSTEAVRRIPAGTSAPDELFVQRTICEFGLFRVVEDFHVLPGLAKGFSTVDAFLGVAQSVANRRKSRAGRSLELHVGQIMREEGILFVRGARTESGRIPDFLFPSEDAYRAASIGDSGIRMLAVKRTLRDRWRQVLDEAEKIPVKHLLTLDEGVSPTQFGQMKERGLQLVVPAPNLRKFQESLRPDLITLGQFLDLVRP